MDTVGRVVASSARGLMLAGLVALSACRTFPTQATAAQIDTLPPETRVVRIRGLPDGDVGSLARLKGLSVINLCGAWRAVDLRMTSAGFSRLAALEFEVPVTVLICEAPTFDDGCLIALGGMRMLRRLELVRCPAFSAAGIDALSQTRLDSLELCGCRQVTDAWVPSLVRPRLRYLGLSGTSVTQEGVRRLQLAMPECTIDLDRASWDK